MPDTCITKDTGASADIYMNAKVPVAVQSQGAGAEWALFLLQQFEDSQRGSAAELRRRDEGGGAFDADRVEGADVAFIDVFERVARFSAIFLSEEFRVDGRRRWMKMMMRGKKMILDIGVFFRGRVQRQIDEDDIVQFRRVFRSVIFRRFAAYFAAFIFL